MNKYERWNEMTPEKKFQAARWEANAETNNATTKQDFKNIVKYLVSMANIARTISSGIEV